ncbi:MAG TPA: DUF2062 domain-containing protein [Steroidobacteraceae bacterium]|nr:DUF2062 domain-containing protein [Steroidobacteraceae bacterium]
MQRWLKSITPHRDSIEKLWFVKPFAAVITQPGCWTFHRASVTRAFALGLFIAFIPPTPFFPVHLLVCSVLGVLLGLNLPVLFATVFVSNPFTWLPQILASIWVGAKLMGIDLMPLVHHLSRHNMAALLDRVWAPLLLGALVLGTLSAALGYALAQFLWRLRVGHHLRRRRARSRAQRRALDQDAVD